MASGSRGRCATILSRNSSRSRSVSTSDAGLGDGAVQVVEERRPGRIGELEGRVVAAEVVAPDVDGLAGRAERLLQPEVVTGRDTEGKRQRRQLAHRPRPRRGAPCERCRTARPRAPGRFARTSGRPRTAGPPPAGSGPSPSRLPPAGGHRDGAPAPPPRPPRSRPRFGPHEEHGPAAPDVAEQVLPVALFQVRQSGQECTAAGPRDTMTAGARSRRQAPGRQRQCPAGAAGRWPHGRVGMGPSGQDHPDHLDLGSGAAVNAHVTRAVPGRRRTRPTHDPLSQPSSVRCRGSQIPNPACCGCSREAAIPRTSRSAESASIPGARHEREKVGRARIEVKVGWIILDAPIDLPGGDRLSLGWGEAGPGGAEGVLADPTEVTYCLTNSGSFTGPCATTDRS